MTQEQDRQAREIVKDAGRLITKLAREEFARATKSHANFVTEIDILVEQQLKNDLQTLLPNTMIVSEERYNQAVEQEGSTWIIDPVDGTTNLIHGYPHFAVSIALVERGNTELAIVYDPIADELFHAVRGQGSYLNDAPIQVSQVDCLRDAIIAFGIPYDRTRADAMMTTAGQVLSECQDIRRAGSSVLDFSYLACGRVDAYFEFDLEAWDHSSGQLIVREAGGTVTDWSDSRLPPGIKSDVVASNGRLHHELLRTIGSGRSN